MRLARANEKCHRLELINDSLNQQIKYLLEKIRLQEETNEKCKVQATSENPSTQFESTPIQSQSNDEDASNLNVEDGIHSFILAF